MDSFARFEALQVLVGTAHDESLRVGRTHVQKWVYFLKRLGYDLGYRFVMHHYGPYSFELASDLDVMASLGLIQVRRHEDDDGFEIIPRDNIGIAFLTQSQRQQWEDNVKALLSKVRKRPTKDLELMATADFVGDVRKRLTGQTPEKQTVFDLLKTIKPGGSEADYNRAIEELRQVVP